MAMPAKSASGKPLGASGVFHSCDCCNEACDFTLGSCGGSFDVTITGAVFPCDLTGVNGTHALTYNASTDVYEHIDAQFDVTISCLENGEINALVHASFATNFINFRLVKSGCDPSGTYTFFSNHGGFPCLPSTMTLSVA